jgi:hypothetical protein
MTEHGEKLCAWMIVPGLVFFFLGMLPAAHFVPPLSPAAGAQGISSFYLEHAVGIQAGSVLMMFGAACLMPFVASISAAMLRMGGRPMAFSLTQLAAGVLTYVPLFLCSMFFAAAAFRSDRTAGEVLLLSDIAWLFLVMPTPAYLIELLAFGFAILRDDSQRPVFPRWVAYFNFWVGILSLPGVLIPLFKTGPFAWDGLLAFWVPLNIFGIWGPVMLWVLLRTGPGTGADRT